MQDHDPSRLSISVIIPTYNRATFIQAAVDSALNQTRVPLEIIVVDDGSTDGTHRLLSAYGAPVRVIRQPNCGRSAARNTGLRAARGDLILFLDSDDLLAPRCIERCARVLEQDTDLSVVYTDAHVMDAGGRIVGRYSQILRGRRPSGNVFDELARRCFLTVSSMVRRSCLAGDVFEEGMEHCEDYDLWRRLAARCRFQFVDEPLLCYRFHDGMTVASEYSKTLESEIEVQRRFMAMPEFAGLTRRQRARAYCAHGIKHAMLDRTDVARRHFRNAVRTHPGYLGGLLLSGISLFGARFLRYTIVKRRQLAGNRLGTHAGPLAVVRGLCTSQTNAPPAPDDSEPVARPVLSETL